MTVRQLRQVSGRFVDIAFIDTLEEGDGHCLKCVKKLRSLTLTSQTPYPIDLPMAPFEQEVVARNVHSAFSLKRILLSLN